MPCEQVFERTVDTEHLFVLQWDGSEQVFGQGDAMSVALELEYEARYPMLRVITGGEVTVPDPSKASLRRVLVGAVALTLLVLLMLPLRALGGATIAGSAPAAGQEYVVQSGDTLASIAARVQPANVAAMVQRLAQEMGSTTIVPGEHLLIP